MVKLQEYRLYFDRSGDVVGPIRHNNTGFRETECPFTNGVIFWRQDGRCSARESSWDLVQEVGETL